MPQLRIRWVFRILAVVWAVNPLGMSLSTVKCGTLVCR